MSPHKAEILVSKFLFSTKKSSLQKWLIPGLGHGKYKILLYQSIRKCLQTDGTYQKDTGVSLNGAQIWDNLSIKINNDSNRLHSIEQNRNPRVHTDINRQMRKYMGRRPTNKFKRSDGIRKLPLVNHFSNNSGRKHQLMLKQEGKGWMRTGYLYSLKVPSYRIMINYKRKE